MSAAAPMLVHVARTPDGSNGWRYGWYVLEHGRLTEVFDNLPGGVAPSMGSQSVLVGSFLYVVTGQRFKEIPSEIFRLDTKNPSNGWTKCADLPFRFELGTLHVIANSIYIFPYETPFPRVNSEESRIWAYVYDTIDNKGQPIEPPNPQFSHSCCNVWSYLEDEQALVSPNFMRKYRVSYDLKNKTWNVGNDLKSFPKLVNASYTVSNGILYWLNTSSILNAADKDDNAGYLLNAYHLGGGGFVEAIKLPAELCFPKVTERIALPFIYLVALGNSEIGFVWSDREELGPVPYYPRLGLGFANVHHATVRISFDDDGHPPKASLVVRRSFPAVRCLNIINCLRFDSFRVQDKEEELNTSRECEETKLWGGKPIQQRMPEKMETKLSSYLSPLMSFATNSSTSVSSNQYKSLIPLIPAASFLLEFKGYLVRGTSLLKKCIK